MNFRIADTFRSSLAKLTANEQKAAKTTVFDLGGGAVLIVAKEVFYPQISADWRRF